MSEAELVLQARLRGGLLNKARRGELRCSLPVGLVYDGDGYVDDATYATTNSGVGRFEMRPRSCASLGEGVSSNVATSKVAGSTPG